MQGEYVSLWIYSRGEAARDLPYLLWKMVEDAGDWEQLLWQDMYEPTRVPRWGDLVHWVGFMHGDADPKCFVLVADNATGDIAGFVWFNRIINDSAYMSIWIDPRYRGKPHIRETGSLGVKWAHEVMNWRTVYAITPWAHVRNLAKKVGFQEVAFIPKLCGPDVWLMEHVNGKE